MPSIVRSYATPRGSVSSTPQGYSWRVTEAALATTAAPGLFDPVVIGYNDSAYRFQDPSHSGFSNPTLLAIEEVRRLSPGEGSHVVLSLGGGLCNLIQPNPPLELNLAELRLEHLERVASDTEAVHRSAWSDFERYAFLLDYDRQGD